MTSFNQLVDTIDGCDIDTASATKIVEVMIAFREARGASLKQMRKRQPAFAKLWDAIEAAAVVSCDLDPDYIDEKLG
jgi:hypothetical protein